MIEEDDCEEVEDGKRLSSHLAQADSELDNLMEEPGLNIFREQIDLAKTKKEVQLIKSKVITANKLIK